jgi:hypothetical protein
VLRHCVRGTTCQTAFSSPKRRPPSTQRSTHCCCTLFGVASAALERKTTRGEQSSAMRERGKRREEMMRWWLVSRSCSARHARTWLERGVETKSAHRGQHRGAHTTRRTLLDTNLTTVSTSKRVTTLCLLLCRVMLQGTARWDGAQVHPGLPKKKNGGRRPVGQDSNCLQGNEKNTHTHTHHTRTHTLKLATLSISLVHAVVTWPTTSAPAVWPRSPAVWPRFKRESVSQSVDLYNCRIPISVGTHLRCAS